MDHKWEVHRDAKLGSQVYKEVHLEERFGPQVEDPQGGPSQAWIADFWRV